MLEKRRGLHSCQPELAICPGPKQTGGHEVLRRMARRDMTTISEHRREESHYATWSSIVAPVLYYAPASLSRA